MRLGLGKLPIVNLLAFELAALAIYGPLVVILHELGHVLFASAGGYRVTAFAIGLGRPLWRFKLGRGPVVVVNQWILAGGACTAIPTRRPGPRRAWYHAGGLIAQLGLGLSVLVTPAAWLVQRVATFNLLVAVTNAVPWRWGNQASDGWHLVDLIFRGQRPGLLLAHRSLFVRLAWRAELAEDDVARRYAELCLAWIDLVSGNAHRAAEAFSSLTPEWIEDPWTDALYHYVYAEVVRCEGDPERAIELARTAIAGALPGAGIAERTLLRVAEGRALVQLGRNQEAIAVLKEADGPAERQARIVRILALLDDPVRLAPAVRDAMYPSQERWLDVIDASTAMCFAANALGRAGQSPPTAGRAAEYGGRLAKRALDAADAADTDAITARLSASLPPTRRSDSDAWAG